MRLTPINYKDLNKYSHQEQSFGHGGESFWKSDYSKKEKTVVAATTGLGVLGSLAGLAKYRGYSLKPKSFFEYLKKADFLFKEITTIGFGTCLGGLAGGYMIDKDPKNRKAKRREAVMQFGNITIPIGTVAVTNKVCNLLKVSDEKPKGQATRTIACFGAIIGGIYLANYAMNKISNIIFNNKSEERDVKATDLFPHIDDVLASAKYVPFTRKSQFIHYMTKIVPFALMVPGNEIGNKKANS